MWFSEFIGGVLKKDKKQFDLKTVIMELGVNAYYKRLAIDACIDLIANTLSRAVFRTFEEGHEVKKNNYYLFNVEPNINQNATDFIHELVSRLVNKNECLVIMHDEQLFIAENWEVVDLAFKEKLYKDVTIKDLTLNKVFRESEVLFYKLNNKRILDVIDGLYKDYGKFISAASNLYKRNNALRGILEMDISRAQTDEEQEMIEDLFNVQFKEFFEAEGGAVLPLQSGLNFEEVFSGSNSSQSAWKDSRDIRAIIDDVIDFVAISLHVPKGLIKGDLADVEAQTDNFLMLCIAPIAELLEDETNRKYYRKENYLKRTYLKIDASMIKHVDITRLANALDKLFSSGTHSINENRNLLDKEPLEEEWASKHFITKNYAEAEEHLKGGEGGDKDQAI
ncbi:phage portal protein [Alkalihalobacillus pseudalcaliphilus]|uniref:phage portal protein n=1 Tax=Alkalihalobacillus pseudalcaliphilus TaxID=79884 RepID=UPI00064DD2AA|nr:phage portal protein [Alkalihalobacillus pseudalcaliphilus]KMK77619.1 portal protein [Alkalihalobacillus pseudalcaliphilus]